jgi:hypothetical protein
MVGRLVRVRSLRQFSPPPAVYAVGGVRQGGTSSVSFLDIDAQKPRHRFFVPRSRRGYRMSGR